MGQTFAEGRPQPARSDNPKTRSWRRKPLPNPRGPRPKLHQQMVPTAFGAPFCSTRACARCWLSVLMSVTAPLPTDVLFPSPSILFFLFFPHLLAVGGGERARHRHTQTLTLSQLDLSLSFSWACLTPSNIWGEFKRLFSSKLLSSPCIHTLQ